MDLPTKDIILEALDAYHYKTADNARRAWRNDDHDMKQKFDKRLAGILKAKNAVLLNKT